MTTSISLWVPLVVAILGLIGTPGGTTAGVVITQRRSDARDNTTWQRERGRWAREDAARTFEHRREAYSDFYESLREMGRTVFNHGAGRSESTEPELPFGWNLPTFQKLQHLQLYASKEVSRLAAEAYSTCWRWRDSTVYGEDDGASSMNYRKRLIAM